MHYRRELPDEGVEFYAGEAMLALLTAFQRLKVCRRGWDNQLTGSYQIDLITCILLT